MSFLPLRPSSVLASLLAVAGVVLAASGCSHIAPLGPEPRAIASSGPRAVQAGPPMRLSHLTSPITLQVMRGEPATPAGRCPAGTVAVSVPQGPGPRECYRPVGKPVTITSAGVSSVSRLPQPSPPPGQSAGPTQYGFMVGPVPADVAAVTAIIRRAYDSRDALGVSAAGKLWEAPQVLQPFSGQTLEMAFLSKNLALELNHILIPAT